MNPNINRAKFLMSYDNKTTLNENAHIFEINNSSVISDWLSPDEKYIIFLDELYDIENKTKLGNIWENFDNFKIFLKHSFEVATNVPQSIKESILEKLNNQLLIESKTNYTSLKPIFKQIINEDWSEWVKWGGETAKDFGKWAYKKGEEAYKNISDFAVTSYEGAKKLIGNISRGEWNEVLNLLKSGVKYVARRLRDAMYHPVGMVLDAILIATGIGKGAQVWAWALIVALDIYEIYTGDTEEPTSEFMQYLFLGFDILGFVFAGGVSGLFKSIFGGARTVEEVAEIAAKNPEARKGLLQMVEGAEKTPGLLSKAADWLSTKFPAGSTFIKGILGFVEKIIGKLLYYLKKILSPKGIVAGVSTAGVVYGIEKGLEKVKSFFSGSTGEEDYKDLMSGDAEYTL
jgi:hypothetical protein